MVAGFRILSLFIVWKKDRTASLVLQLVLDGQCFQRCLLENQYTQVNGLSMPFEKNWPESIDFPDQFVIDEYITNTFIDCTFDAYISKKL